MKYESSVKRSRSKVYLGKILPVFLAIALTGCGYATEDNTEEHGQRIDCPFFEEDITMYPGEVVSGWMSIQGGDTAYDEVVFSTDDPSVAKINLVDTRADTFLYYEIYAAGEGDTYVCAKTEDGETLSPKQHVTVSKTETETETESEYYITAGRIDTPAPEKKRETETETERETEPETYPPAVFYLPQTQTTPETIAETSPETVIVYVAPETIPETKPVSVKEPSPETEIIKADEPSSMTEERIEELEGKAVFWAPTGHKVHLDPACWSFKLGVTYAGTLEEAESVREKGWCGSCGQNGSYDGKNTQATKEVLAECYTYEDYIAEIPSRVFE